ncbi:MAG: hypothetical protein V3V33_05995 [Candidatus Lokiarchaeia archaeon]
MIRQQKIVKNLIHFAKREFDTKRPLSVQVLRMKSERILTKGGPLKVLSISRIPNIYYLILALYKDHFRIFYRLKKGEDLGARHSGYDDVNLHYF